MSTSTHGSDSRRQILVADDSLLSRSMLRRILERDGYEVLAVGNGLDALDLLTRPDAPRLAILDWNMPGLDGIEVCRQLRENPAINPYIILLTGKERPDDVVHGLRAGADDYLVKPFDSAVLTARIHVGWRIVDLQARLSENITWLEAANAQTAQLASVVETTTDAVAGISPSGAVLTWNRGAEQILGYAASEVICTPLVDLLGDGHEEVVRRITETIEHGASLERLEVVAARKDGMAINLSLTVSPMRNVDGETVGAAAIARDITEQRRAEQQLRESEARLQMAIEASKLGTWQIDLANEAIEWSDQEYEIFGIGRDECPLDLDRILKLVHPEDRDRMRDLLDAATRTDGVTIEFRVVRPNGDIRWVESKARVYRDEPSPAGRLIGTSVDITERRSLEIQLRQAQKLESIGQLAAGIAHEINTPTQYVGDNIRFLSDAFRDLTEALDAYRAALDGIAAGGDSASVVAAIREDVDRLDVAYLVSEIPKAIEQSLDGTQRISKIVRSMKDFSHPGTQAKQMVDLNRAIESTINVAHNEWKYVADVETRFDPALPLVPCLLGELNQAVLNLVVNAAHAIADVVDEKGEKGRITITTRTEGVWAVVEVADTGTGIPDELHTRIFDPFFTTKEVGKGTGQGLAICYAVVVDKHSGEISFGSDMGLGTRFTIRLPLAD